MFDNLRDESSQSPFFNEEDRSNEAKPRFVMPGENFLGMTPVQRFIVALMLFLMVCVTGTFFLLVTEKIVPIF